MGPEGLINMLTVLPPAEILKGIQYIRAHLDEGVYVQLFDKFWIYFRKV